MAVELLLVGMQSCGKRHRLPELMAAEGLLFLRVQASRGGRGGLAQLVLKQLGLEKMNLFLQGHHLLLLLHHQLQLHGSPNRLREIRVGLRRADLRLGERVKERGGRL